MKTELKKIPFVRSVVRSIRRRIISFQNKSFKNSPEYWEKRYAEGGDSGRGSYNRLAQFKAETINQFLDEHKIITAIEFGCGDGSQLSMIKYPQYIGLDVSKTIIQFCINKFSDDKSKSFYLFDPSCFADNQELFKCDLSLSLDVVYHIIEDALFEKYMTKLFNAATKYTIVYSSNYNSRQLHHVKQREFSKFVDAKLRDWILYKVIRNPFPYDADDEDNTSSADFHIYKKNVN